MNDALRAAAEAATPGPWRHLSQKDGNSSYQSVDWVMAGEPDYAHFLVKEDHVTALHGSGGRHIPAEANAAYIALASPDRILGILDENKELRAALQSLTKAVEWAFAGTDELTARGPLQRAHAKARAALEGKP